MVQINTSYDVAFPKDYEAKTWAKTIGGVEDFSIGEAFPSRSLMRFWHCSIPEDIFGMFQDRAIWVWNFPLKIASFQREEPLQAVGPNIFHRAKTLESELCFMGKTTLSPAETGQKLETKSCEANRHKLERKSQVAESKDFRDVIGTWCFLVCQRGAKAAFVDRMGNCTGDRGKDRLEAL